MSGGTARQSKWTESVAVGNKQFVVRVREKLRLRAAGRIVMANGISHEPNLTTTFVVLTLIADSVSLQPLCLRFYLSRKPYLIQSHQHKNNLKSPNDPLSA